MPSNRKPNFCTYQIQQYFKIRADHKEFSESSNCAKQLVNNFLTYYERLSVRDRQKQIKRKNSCLMTAQTYLSLFKKKLAQQDSSIPPQFLKQLRLNKEQHASIVKAKNEKLHANAINLPSVNADLIIKDCRSCLATSQDPYKKLIALACLTGRRVSELLVTISFDPPKNRHTSTHLKYWSHVTGFLKQRSKDPDRVISRELPLFDSRTNIVQALRFVREQLGTGSYTGQSWAPTITVQEANRKHAKPVSRSMRKHCNVICNIHQFRKFYALACFHYFNENHCSLPRLASDYLGHKSVSSTILTYLNFRVENLGSLQFNT